MKRLLAILLLAGATLCSAAPASAANHHHHHNYNGSYGSSYGYRSYPYGITTGYGVPYGYGGYGGYGRSYVNRGYVGNSFANPAAFGYGPQAVQAMFGY